jgi:hypothetical protein
MPEGWEMSIPERDEDEYFASWCDATLQADHWFSMPVVGPTEAAMVLCGFSPNEEDFQSAIRSQPPVIWSDQPRKLPKGALRDLEQQFQSLDKARPACRALVEWLEVADTRKLQVHPWVHRYVELRQPAPVAQDPLRVEATMHRKGDRWTEGELLALFSFHSAHGTKATAAKYGINPSRVRLLIWKVKDGNRADNVMRPDFWVRAPG